MGCQRRNQSGKGGPRWTQSSFPHKEVMDFSRPRKTKAIWVPSIPSWEKEFCKQSISLPWKEFCEVKKYTVWFPEIEKWNDSAAEEAFHLAKKRYFAKINGTPCDIPEIDPNVYIDEVDWTSLDSGDIDWPEEYDSDSEDEENCARMESIPTLYQDMTTSEKERYEKNKIQWTERPFGYGQIYFPEILEARTVICKVVDLYTAQPQLLNHWKVDLWSKDSRMPMACAAKNEFGVSGWGSEFENEKEVICHSGWDEHEKEVIFHSGWGSEFDHKKEVKFENEKEVICHSGWDKHEKEVIFNSGWGSKFDHKKEVIFHSGWGSEFEDEKEVIFHSGWGSEFKFEHEKKVICNSTALPLDNKHPKKKERKKNKIKKHRDQNDMNVKNNCRPRPKNVKGRSYILLKLQ